MKSHIKVNLIYLFISENIYLLVQNTKKIFCEIIVKVYFLAYHQDNNSKNVIESHSLITKVSP